MRNKVGNYVNVIAETHQRNNYKNGVSTLLRWRCI